MNREVPLCGCGSANDAVKTGLKLAKQMFENDCALWALQVLHAAGMMSEVLACAMHRGDINDKTVRASLALMKMNYLEVLMNDDEFVDQMTKFVGQVVDDAIDRGIPDRGISLGKLGTISNADMDEIEKLVESLKVSMKEGFK